MRSNCLITVTRRVITVGWLALLSSAAFGQVVSVVEYYNRVIDGYFITSRPVEQTLLDQGTDFERTGMSFATTAGSNANAANSICRFYISLVTPYTSSHFYGLQTPDCTQVLQLNPAGFTYEGIDFAVGLRTGSACPAATPVPVYRSFRPTAPGRTANHRYTVAQTSYNKMATVGWTQEGIAFCAASATDAAAVWPPATNGLYTGTSKYTVGVFDGYTVRDVAHSRDVPILIRYPINAGNAKLPVIVWSHGGGPNIDGKYISSEWGNALAAIGYVVVHMSHSPPTDAEGAALIAEFAIPTTDLAEARETMINVIRPRDTIAVINALPTIEAVFAQAQGRLDFSRVGIAGHSRGAYSVRTTACARIALVNDPDYSFRSLNSHNTPLAILPKAFMAASPQGPGTYGFKDNSWRECALPDLTLSGVGDDTDGSPSEDRVKPFQLMPPGDKYLMFINDPATIHNTFNLNDDVKTFDPWLIAAGRAFFDAHLRNSLIGKTYLSSGRTELVSGGKATVSAR